jgi:hypothetical protein
VRAVGEIGERAQMLEEDLHSPPRWIAR